MDFIPYSVSNECLYHWNLPHRYYHNINHLYNLLDKIERLNICRSKKQDLRVATLFHDVIYDPRKNDNEVNSVKFFQKFQDKINANPDEVIKLIMSTITHEHNVLNYFDMEIMNSDLSQLIEWGKWIFKEFQFLKYSEYLEKRIQFLNKWKNKYSKIEHLIQYLNSHKPKIGIYAGTFNPFHIGYINILEKAEKIFDKVIIASGINPEKVNTNHSINCLPFHETISFCGLLTSLVQEYSKFCDVTVIRGLRSGYDLNYEMNMLRFMQYFDQNVKVIYIVCNKEFEHISSSMLKGLKNIGENIDGFLVHKYDYAQKYIN